MTAATTEKYEEMVLDVEFVDSSGTYTAICGMMDVTISRSATIDSTEIPDCDDESLPHTVKKSVRSVEVSVSGTGVWAESSQGLLKGWFYGGTAKNVRLRDTAAATGDTEIESGAAVLAGLNNSRTKGQEVTAEIEIQFTTTPTRTDAS